MLHGCLVERIETQLEPMYSTPSVLGLDKRREARSGVSLLAKCVVVLRLCSYILVVFFDSGLDRSAQILCGVIPKPKTTLRSPATPAVFLCISHCVFGVGWHRIRLVPNRVYVKIRVNGGPVHSLGVGFERIL